MATSNTVKHPKHPKAVFGAFETRMELENTVDNLKAQGFRNSDISVLIPNGDDGKEGFVDIRADDFETKATEGATTGAIGGIAFGGALGWLAGAGALLIPGVGPFVAAGPIMAAIAGAGIAGTIGGVAGALMGSGIPENEAKKYEEYLKGGAMLLSVHADDMDWMNRARLILQSGGAIDVTSIAEPTNKSRQNDIDRNISPTL
jgi:hypothetical protein